MSVKIHKINDVVTLLDKKSYLHSILFKKFAIESIDGMEFYYRFGEKSQLPYIGIFYKVMMTAYYKYVHTSSIKLPLKDIIAVIEKAHSFSVGPCPCRIILHHDECDAPLYTCLRINYFSEFAVELQDKVNKARIAKGRKPNYQSKELTKTEAIELMRHAHKHNLIFSLESCISPYQNNICTCCTDCCIELQQRYKFGLDVSPGGPYIPVVNEEICTGCGKCAARCPLKCITMVDKKPKIDFKKCLGCGHCEDACAFDAIQMEVEPSRIPKYKEPGPLKMVMVILLLLIMYFFFKRYKKQLLKRGGKSGNYKYSMAKPRKSDLIQDLSPPK